MQQNPKHIGFSDGESDQRELFVLLRELGSRSHLDYLDEDRIDAYAERIAMRFRKRGMAVMPLDIRIFHLSDEW